MRYTFQLTIKTPKGSLPLNREELAEHFLDAVSGWHGQLDPDDELWSLANADFAVSYKEYGKKQKVNFRNSEEDM